MISFPSSLSQDKNHINHRVRSCLQVPCTFNNHWLKLGRILPSLRKCMIQKWSKSTDNCLGHVSGSLPSSVNIWQTFKSSRRPYRVMMSLPVLPVQKRTGRAQSAAGFGESMQFRVVQTADMKVQSISLCLWVGQAASRCHWKRQNSGPRHLRLLGLFSRCELGGQRRRTRKCWWRGGIRSHAY